MWANFDCEDQPVRQIWSYRQATLGRSRSTANRVELSQLQNYHNVKLGHNAVYKAVKYSDRLFIIMALSLIILPTGTILAKAAPPYLSLLKHYPAYLDGKIRLGPEKELYFESDKDKKNFYH